ncbi:GBF-interacting protein 1-like [Selaginella moellendorffii]|uniref:GBF-interacting protein 1-like n=1 Tax=Selaginella moellendorffii TaxID=88036 RepID=UPI000D1CBFA4|nr:GBF-interacting protein 1-like [Selaginella moellendorffii]|eukprot:XP_024529562.1 GBF-interacting protein 1-like [Selaginella moellendorffii]
MTVARASSGASGASEAAGGMAAPSTAAAASTIPSSARKMVQSIKEIAVERSDDEIYAMLKECGMDLNEAVQRLLNQDTFHEVKRKRDKKRENKDGSSDIKPARGPSSSARGGRYGRGGSRYEPSGGGRGRGAPRENGYYPKSSGPQEAPPSAVPPKLPSGQASNPTPAPAAHNEQAAYHRPSLSGGARPTIAEILKSSTMQTAVQPPRPPMSSDPVALEPGITKRDVGVVGNQRSSNEVGDMEPPLPGDYVSDEQAPLPDGHPGISSTSSATDSSPPPRATYSSSRHQAPVGSQKPGVLQEWKVKPSSTVPSVATDTYTSDFQRAPAPATTSKFEDKEDQSVIIHNQFLASADLNLNFGSLTFGSDEDSLTHKPSAVEDEPEGIEEEEEEPDDQPSPSTASNPAAQNYDLPQTSAMADSLPSNSEVTAVSIAVPAVSHSELSKPDSSVQSSHYPYLPTAYSGFGLMAQPGTQYPYESSDSQLSDGSRFSSLHQHYSDPTASYYTPAYRPNVETDMRYPLMTSKAAAAKYSTSMTSVASLASSESGNSGSSLAQTSQPTSGQSVPSLPHQPLPLHAYSAQPSLHLGYNMFNYPYLHQSVPYMHAPYQHSFAGNSAYPQPPAGSNYPPTNNYPTAAAKYPMAQYKPVTATASTIHSASAAGYAGYTSSPAGYATNPMVTLGPASLSYDEAALSQYKDSNVYIQSQQGEGFSRESFYNIPSQSQYTAYAQQHHGHPTTAYGSLYHPTQSVPAPNSHQMLQQPQTLATAGSQGAAAAAAAYGQQPQRGWNNSY